MIIRRGRQFEPARSPGPRVEQPRQLSLEESPRANRVRGDDHGFGRAQRPRGLVPTADVIVIDDRRVLQKRDLGLSAEVSPVVVSDRARHTETRDDSKLPRENDPPLPAGTT
jgi:hypothetical protein